MDNTEYTKIKEKFDLKVGNTFTDKNDFSFKISSINKVEDIVEITNDFSKLTSEISFDYLEMGYKDNDYTVIHSKENAIDFSNEIKKTQLKNELEDAILVPVEKLIDTTFLNKYDKESINEIVDNLLSIKKEEIESISKELFESKGEEQEKWSMSNQFAQTELENLDFIKEYINKDVKIVLENELQGYFNSVSPHDGGLDALINFVDYELYSKVNWDNPKETPIEVIKDLTKEINNNSQKNFVNGLEPKDHIKKYTNNTFLINEIPMNELQKLGIKKDDFLKNSDNLEKLLSGNKTNSIPLNKFDALDIKVRLELVKNAQNEVQLIVTPDKMELKNDYQKTIDSLLKNKGVLENSTDKINNLKETISNHNDIKFLNEPSVEKSFNDLKEKYPNVKEKDITPDTWLKVDSNIAQLYKEKYNLPVIKVKDEHHIGFKLKDIDKHSLKQNKDVLKQVSNSLNQRKTTISR